MSWTKKNISVQQPLILKWYFYYLCYECYLFIFIEIIPIIMFICFIHARYGMFKAGHWWGFPWFKPAELLSGSPRDGYKGSALDAFVLYSMFVQLYLQKYPIFVVFLDKIKYPNCPISQYEYRYDPWYCHHYASDIIVCRSHHR